MSAFRLEFGSVTAVVAGPATELLAGEIFDLRGCVLVAHLDEAEATRTTGLAIGHDLRRGHGAHLREKVGKVVRSR